MSYFPTKPPDLCRDYGTGRNPTDTNVPTIVSPDVRMLTEQAAKEDDPPATMFLLLLAIGPVK